MKKRNINKEKIVSLQELQEKTTILYPGTSGEESQGVIKLW